MGSVSVLSQIRSCWQNMARPMNATRNPRTMVEGTREGGGSGGGSRPPCLGTLRLGLELLEKPEDVVSG